jgi:hypothetical protein
VSVIDYTFRVPHKIPPTCGESTAAATGPTALRHDEHEGHEVHEEQFVFVVIVIFVILVGKAVARAA